MKNNSAIRVFITLCLVSCFFSLSYCNSPVKKPLSNTSGENQQTNQPLTDTSSPKKAIISFSAVGDIMLGSNYPSVSKLPPSNQPELLHEVDSLLRSTDFTFGNCEGTFLNSGGTPKGSGPNVYCFRQPEAYASKLTAAGFDLISIANNHINDFGGVGIQSTAKTLEKEKLHYAGSPDHPYDIVTKDGVRIGLIAFAPHKGCLDLNDMIHAEEMVRDLKKKVEVVMVSFHAGAEGAPAQHVTRKREFFFGQDRGNVHEFAHRMIDAGADILIGHGPHVVRAMEIYKSRLIAYSLGNFCTYGMFSLKGESAAAPLLQFKINEKGEFLGGQIHSFKQIGEGGPITDNDKLAISLIKKLSENDIPESPLSITSEGVLSVKK